MAIPSNLTEFSCIITSFSTLKQTGLDLWNLKQVQHVQLIRNFIFFVGLKMAILMGSIHRSVFTIVNRRSISMKTRTSRSTPTTTSTTTTMKAPTPTKYVKFDESGNVLTPSLQWWSEIWTSLAFWMVKNRLGYNWSGFWMGSEIQQPNHLKSRQMGLSKTIWNLTFKKSGFKMVRFQIPIVLALTYKHPD